MKQSIQCKMELIIYKETGLMIKPETFHSYKGRKDGGAFSWTVKVEHNDREINEVVGCDPATQLFKKTYKRQYELFISCGHVWKDTLVVG